MVPKTFLAQLETIGRGEPLHDPRLRIEQLGEKSGSAECCKLNMDVVTTRPAQEAVACGALELARPILL